MEVSRPAPQASIGNRSSLRGCGGLPWTLLTDERALLFSPRMWRSASRRSQEQLAITILHARGGQPTFVEGTPKVGGILRRRGGQPPVGRTTLAACPIFSTRVEVYLLPELTDTFQAGSLHKYGGRPTPKCPICDEMPSSCAWRSAEHRRRGHWVRRVFSTGVEVYFPA